MAVLTLCRPALACGLELGDIGVKCIVGCVLSFNQLLNKTLLNFSFIGIFKV